jgi:23S rRNA (uridine2552-2'-O)-methyltransferase
MNRAKPDHYTHRAKQSGYPARSVYKLEEIQKRFHLLKRGQRILDIGAAPGSWSMYSSELVGEEGLVVSVDLKEFSIPDPRGNIRILEGDAFSDSLRAELAVYAPFEVILSDAAPSTTGNRTVDTARSAGIAEQCILSAKDMLKEGGSLVIKVFQGGEEQQLLKRLKELFRTAKAFKPEASRKESFEVFFVADGFRGRRE